MLTTIKGGITPTKGSKYSAAVDLYANEDVIIGAGETAIIGLGVVIDSKGLTEAVVIDCEGYLRPHTIDQFLEQHYLQLEPRSSIRTKGLQAGTGIIDLDYKDEIKLILTNPLCKVQFGEMNKGCNGENVYQIKKGDKIAQIMLKEHKTFLMGIESNDERTGGLGSTGK